MERKKIKKNGNWQFQVDQDKLDADEKKRLKQERLEKYAELKKTKSKDITLDFKSVPEKTLRAISRSDFTTETYLEDKMMIPATVFGRAFAFIIDSILITVLFTVTRFEEFSVIIKDYFKFDIKVFKGYATEDSIIGLLLFLFLILFPTMLWGRTIGKKLIGIKVKNVNKSNIGFLQAIFREVLIKPLFFVGIVTIFFNKQRRSVHDFLARTQVIKNQNQTHKQ